MENLGVPTYLYPTIIWMPLQQLGESNGHQQHGSTHLSSSKSWGLKPWFGGCWLNSEPQCVPLLGQPPCPGPWASRHPLAASRAACLSPDGAWPEANQPCIHTGQLSGRGHYCDRVNPSGAANFTLYRAKLSSPAMWFWCKSISLGELVAEVHVAMCVHIKPCLTSAVLKFPSFP